MFPRQRPWSYFLCCCRCFDKQSGRSLGYTGFCITARIGSLRLLFGFASCLIHHSDSSMPHAPFQISVLNIDCSTSPCTGLSPARTTIGTPLPYRIFRDFSHSSFLRFDLGNPRLVQNGHSACIVGYDFRHFSTYRGGQSGTPAGRMLAYCPAADCITFQSTFVMVDDRTPLAVVQAV